MANKELLVQAFNNSDGYVYCGYAQALLQHKRGIFFRR
jgi:hypothetical protein